MNWILLMLAGLIVLGLGTAVWWGSRRIEQSATMLLHPRRTQHSQTPADFGLTAETVRISADGIELVAWYIPPTEAVDGATLIYLHGFGGNRGALLEQVAAMHEVGYGALLLDLRNHGESGDAITTWGYNEANDVAAAYDYLLTQPAVNPSRIGLVGKSMGGAAVVRAAAELPDLAVLVVESTYSSIEDNINGIVGITRAPGFLATPIFDRMKAESGVPLSEVNSVALMESLDVPLLIIHGERDQLVPIAQGEAIFAAANEPKMMHAVPNAGHLNIFTVDPATFTEQMRGFLAEHLQ